MSSKKLTVFKAPLVPFVLITTLFFMWGLANNMTDTLLAAFKKIMSLNDFQTSWIQMAFYGAYFCLALPAAIFIKRFTYKAGVLLGLGMFVGGALLFYPSSLTMNYFHFLLALYILAGGLSILETTSNPYIIAMGPEENGTQRLNFAQSFNPIGSITGVVLSKFFILSNLNSASAEDRALMSPDQLQSVQAQELNAVMGPYVGVALLLVVIWIVIAARNMPAVSDKKVSINLMPTLKRLIRKKQYAWGVVSQFFYVGAQIGVWSFTIRYVMAELAINEAEASTYYLVALILFTVFRFINTALMKFFTPGVLLTSSAILGGLATLVVIFAGGMVGVIALVSISAFMSLMFPTIYGLAVQGLDYDDTKIAGSGLIMAILGGAVLTAIQGKISDATGSIHLAYFVPFICFVLISFYGRFGYGDKPLKAQE